MKSIWIIIKNRENYWLVTVYNSIHYTRGTVYKQLLRIRNCFSVPKTQANKTVYFNPSAIYHIRILASRLCPNQGHIARLQLHINRHYNIKLFILTCVCSYYFYVPKFIIPQVYAMRAENKGHRETLYKNVHCII